MILKKIGENLFLTLVGFSYLATFIISPTTGVESVKNSGYYIREMIMIMPVIFVLTALLDMWIPKEKIMEFLGEESKGIGMFLSFVIGSISAGPIYAAFPMCVMLLNKGASIRNIIIILSSWSVVKIPMLINEVKFLGFKFMIIRWILTIIGIIIFSWIAGLIVKEEDLPLKEEVDEEPGLSINRSACMGCTICAKKHPEIFKMEGNKAVVIDRDLEIDVEMLEICPVGAIKYRE